MNKRIGYGIALLLLLAAPFALYPVFLMKLLCFALFACAFNLLIGFTGLLSFGHAAFFGGAGYIAGYALRSLGLPMELGLLFGTATGALIGLVMGQLAIRRQGIYFTMITLALAQMIYFLCLQLPFTGGEDGLQSVPRQAAGHDQPRKRPDPVLPGAGDRGGGVCADHAHRALAFRPGIEGDQGK